RPIPIVEHDDDAKMRCNGDGKAGMRRRDGMKRRREVGGDGDGNGRLGRDVTAIGGGWRRRRRRRQMNECLRCNILIVTFAPQTNVALDVIKSGNVSAALFAPGWIYETKQPPDFATAQNR
ncbi:hypothetical protein C3L33_03931, partial [Rhododendron williamsianum]